MTKKKGRFKIFALFDKKTVIDFPAEYLNYLIFDYAFDWDYQTHSYFDPFTNLYEIRPGLEWSKERPDYLEVVNFLKPFEPVFYEVTEYNLLNINAPPGQRTLIYYYDSVRHLFESIYYRDNAVLYQRSLDKLVHLLVRASGFHFYPGEKGGILFVHEDYISEFGIKSPPLNLLDALSFFSNLIQLAKF